MLRGNKKAFTTIELIVAIIVIGILAIFIANIWEGMVENYRIGIDRSRAQQSARAILRTMIQDVQDGTAFTVVSANEFEVTLDTGQNIRYKAVLASLGDSTFEVRRIINNTGSGDLVGKRVHKFGSGLPGLDFEYFDAENVATTVAANAKLVLVTLTMQLDKGNTVKFGSGVTFHPKATGPLTRRP